MITMERNWRQANGARMAINSNAFLGRILHIYQNSVRKNNERTGQKTFECVASAVRHTFASQSVVQQI